MFATLETTAGHPITPRKGKSTPSIIAKLKREHTRLHTMQDIAGCRIVVDDILEQNETVDRILNQYKNAIVQDFREAPRSGYRAVHIIITFDGLPLEVQVRSGIQDAWAQTSEKFADTYGNELKYGGGPEDYRQYLLSLSELVHELEGLEFLVRSSGETTPDVKLRLKELAERAKGILSKAE